MTAGFGLEKLGLFSLRHAWASIIIVALITPILAFGASRLELSSDVREIFRSDDAAFDLLDQVSERFPGSQQHLHVVVESDAPFDSEDLKALKTLDETLENAEGVKSVLSIFSATARPDNGGKLVPLFPDDLSGVEASQAIREEASRHPLIADRLLADDWTLTVLSLSLVDSDPADEKVLVEKIQEKTEEVLDGTGLTVGFAGLSVMRLEIIEGLARDQKTFRLVALSIALGLCWAFFGRLSFVVISGLPAILAVIWLMGGMWIFGEKITLLTGIAPTIVLVIVFSNCLHLLFAVRSGIAGGKTLEEAVETAVRRIGPACVLTSLTTALALASLVWMPHPFISDFGVTAGAGTALALVATLLLVPALSMILLRGYAEKARGKPVKDVVRKAMNVLCGWFASAVATAPQAIAILGLLIVLAGGWLHLQNEPRYSYASNLQPSSSSLEAVKAVNEHLGGANTVDVLVDFGPDHSIKSFKTLDVVRKVHQAIASDPAFSAITSLHAIELWFGGTEEEREDALLEFMNSPEAAELSRSFLDPEEKTILITAQFKDLTSDELEPIIERLNRRLATVAEEAGGVEISVTGMVPVSTQASHAMISELNISLMVAIGMILALIGVAMRSVQAGLVSILPNLFPLAVGGAYLQLVEGGLQFTSLVAFTVGFGLAVDSTIHMLNYYRLERSGRQTVSLALRKTITTVGPAVIMATVVLAAGIGTSLLSSLPPVHLYGLVVVIVLSASMLGALLFLPALMSSVERWRAGLKRMFRRQEA